MIKKAILAKGCPPTFEEVIEAFEQCGIMVNMDAYQKLQQTFIIRYQGKEGFDRELFYLKE